LRANPPWSPVCWGPAPASSPAGRQRSTGPRPGATISSPGKYSLTSHVNEPNLLLMSAMTAQKLPKDVQEAIARAGREASEFQRKASAEYNANIMGELKKVMSVNDVPADTLAHFSTVGQSVYEKAYGEIGAEGRALIDDIVKASK
jgi:TRAP-type C4-dicarboxylate transport system substrate-binding protein